MKLPNHVKKMVGGERKLVKEQQTGQKFESLSLTFKDMLI